MANSIYSTDQQIWKDILDENWGTISSLIASRIRNSSQLETVGTLTDYHTFLVNYSQGGVSKIQRTSIDTLARSLDTYIGHQIDSIEEFLEQAQENEQTRINNESVRQADESTRQSQESTRQSNEANRTSAEASRVSQWTSWFTNGVTQDWAQWFSDTIATGVRKVWNTWFSNTKTEWNTLKSSSQSATSAAVMAASNANEKAEYAESQGDRVNTAIENYEEISTSAQEKGNYAKAQGDRAKGFNDHPWELGNDGYLYVWDENHQNQDGTYGAMVQTNKVMFSWSDMSDEQKQAITTQIMASLTFATKNEAASAVNELT